MTISRVTAQFSQHQLSLFLNNQMHPYIDKASEHALATSLWFIRVAINDRRKRPYLALMDTGCSVTCINEELWKSLERTKKKEHHSFVSVVRGVSGESSASIRGSALVDLFIRDDHNQVLRMTMRAMIVRNLDGLMFIGQDLFSNPDLYSAMRHNSIVLKSRAAKHTVSYIGIIRQELVYICKRMIPSGRLTLEVTCSVTIRPKERRRIEVSGDPRMKLGSEVEIGPLDEKIVPIREVPSVNCFPEQRSAVMVETEADHSVVITQGQAVCQIVGLNVQDDYSLVAEVSGDTPLSALSKDEVEDEDKDPEAPSDSEAEMERNLGVSINKLVDEMVKDAQEDPCTTVNDVQSEADKTVDEANAAIMSEVDIPEEHDIMKKPRTLSDDKLLAKFELDHLSEDDRARIEALILRFRQIWSEHSFDLGNHRFVQHDIVLKAPLPPCPKQRFWPASK